MSLQMLQLGEEALFLMLDCKQLSLYVLLPRLLPQELVDHDLEESLLEQLRSPELQS